MKDAPYRLRLIEYLRAEANPPDKFSHQARLYALAKEVVGNRPHDDDVLFAAAWLHDLGVFIGHRPRNLKALATWDNVAYAMRQTPVILKRLRFPARKIPAVVEAIRTHQPAADPTSYEGIVLRDADILEQLGAVSVLRTVSKVGRDTRFLRFSDALKVLQRNLTELPKQIRLASARRLARPRLKALEVFLEAAEEESMGGEW